MAEISTESSIANQDTMHLSAPMRLAAYMKVEGATHEMIIDALSRGGKRYSLSTVKHWFAAGGALEGFVLELSESMANQSLREAQELLQMTSRQAVLTLMELDKHPNPKIRLEASKAILDRTLPVSRGIGSSRYIEEDEIPIEIIEAGNRILDQATTELIADAEYYNA